MPPLCTVGLGAALERWPLAGGALLLFATNIVSICLAGVMIFRWLGVRPHERERRPWRQRIGVLLLVVGLMAIPLTPAVIQIAHQQANVRVVQAVLGEMWGDGARVELVNVEMGDYEDALRVIATVRATTAPDTAEVGEIQTMLENRLDHPLHLDVVVLEMVRLPRADSEESAAQP
jgi:uncharacterized membrane protein